MIASYNETHDDPYKGAFMSPIEKTCPKCNGAGYPPERFMGDPQGQKPCKACGGSGRVKA